jgi:PAS domain S-box-containing protein
MQRLSASEPLRGAEAVRSVRHFQHDPIDAPEPPAAKRSITRRLAGCLVITVILVSGLAFAVMHHVMSEAATKDLERKADDTLRYLVGTLEAPLWDLNNAEVIAIAKAVSRDESVAQLAVRDASGAVIFSTAAGEISGLIRIFDKIVHIHNKQPMLIGDVALSVSPQLHRQRFRRTFAFFVSLITLILLSVAVVAVVYIRWALNKPMTALNTITGRFALGAYGVSDVALPYREFQPFGKALADMGQRISEQIQRVHEAESRCQRMVDTATEGIMTLAPDGAITFLNGKTAEMLGYSCEEMLGRPLTDFAGEEKEKDCLRIEFLRRGVAIGRERRLRRKDGETMWTLISAAPLGDGCGHNDGVLAMLTDITERKLAEARILQINQELEQRVSQRTAALEAANKELEAFSYSVSHDLRAPLRTVSAYSQILLEDHQASLDAEARRCLDTIRQGAARMNSLIDDLLAFSRMSRSAVAQEPIDMAAMAREVFAELSAVAPDRNIRLILSDLPPARGDSAMVRQVFSNLLGNAIKYSSPRPETVIEVSGKAETGENLYRIKDNGVGFDMSCADRLFGVFQRLHSAREFEGTGIGLALVKRIVERHGGRIWAKGVVNEGATLCFTLPQ